MGFKDSPIVMGTASGTLVSTFAMVAYDDIVRTIFLATLGAVVSFVVSYILNKLSKPFRTYRMKRKKKKKRSKD